MKLLPSTFLLACLVLLLTAAPGRAQNSPVLEGYVRQGLSSNLALKQPQFAFEKSMLSLKEANSLFLPTVNFDVQYSLAHGGRTISLPVGDLLNPVYQTLNQMMDANRFPTIANEKVQFLPNNFQTTRLIATQPLINAEIYYNRRLKRELITYQQAEVKAYKRELVKQIKTAYFKYLQAGAAVDIYRSALGLVKENLRLNEKLVKNQAALGSSVYRSKAEVSRIEAQLVEAENNQRIAAYYFNSLLNQSFDTPITIDSTILRTPLESASWVELNDESTLNRREEMQKLSSALRVNDYQVSMSKSYLIPTLSHSLEGGYQGFGFKYDGTQQYWMYNVSLRWNVFKGLGNQWKVKQSILDRASLEAQKDQAEQQIRLQIQTTQYNLNTAERSLQSARDAMTNSEEFFRVTNRRYQEGQALLIEFLDARNQLTSAQINHSIAQFQLLIRAAETEQATAGYTLD